MLDSSQESKQTQQRQQTLQQHQQPLSKINSSSNTSDCTGNGNRTVQTNQQLAAISAKSCEVTFEGTSKAAFSNRAKKDSTMAVQKDDGGISKANDRLKPRVLSSSSGRNSGGVESGSSGGVIANENTIDGRVDGSVGVESISSIGPKNPLANKRCSVSTSNLMQVRSDSVSGLSGVIGIGVNDVNNTVKGDPTTSGGDQVIKMRRQRLQQQSSQQSQRSVKHHHRTTNEKTKSSCDNFYGSQSTMHSHNGSKRPATSNRGIMHNSSDSSSSSSSSSCSGSCASDDGDSSSSSSGVPNLPYPGFTAIAFKYLTQDTRPRNWCLMFITNPWFERISILIILLNCITLGMYQPCVDDACVTNRCKILQIIDDIIFAFFALEMSIKMVAMGLYGKDTYLADAWNRLDCLIVFAGLLEYVMHVENLNLTAIRTIRVLRPLRAINRIPSMRILVMLLLDTLPMLGNVLLLCFFVFFIFGIVGVQLWEGILRQRCVLDLPQSVPKPNISFYYEFSKEQDYICSKPEDSGMHLCSDLPQYRIGPMLCNDSALPFSMNYPSTNSCVNWNQYYTNCKQSGGNPFQGTISFDNIGMAWVAIFLVISLEGWTDIMYYVQDAHSFWDWIYFVLLIVIGSFFMINLCLVVIATQFSETKKREMERMRQERARYTSTSTLASSTNNSEPATCYAEIVKYIAHLWRRFKRRLAKKYRLYKCQQQQRKDGLLPNTENLTFSPSRIKNHHPKCPKLPKKPSNIQDQMITVMVPLNSNNNRSRQPVVQNLTMPSMNNIINNNNNNSGTGNGNGGNGGNGAVGGNNSGIIIASNGYNSSPDNSEMSLEISGRSSNLKRTNHASRPEENSQKPILLKIPSGTDSEQLINPCSSGFLSPPTSARRRSSVMFNEYVILHAPPTIPEPTSDKNVCSSEKMTQAGDGSIWQVNLPQTLGTNGNPYSECSELGIHDAMTCQELLAFSVAFSAALPTGHSTLESFYTSLAHYNSANDEIIKNQQNIENSSNVIKPQTGNYMEDFACCYDLYQNTLSPQEEKKPIKSKWLRSIVAIYRCLAKCFKFLRKYIKLLVEHKYFNQGILFAILINTLSMGIEYHDQPEELTAIVEMSNIIFSAIFAVEMLLKVIGEGPFSYIANGFNVFDGVIVILSGIEICQTYLGDGGSGSSGLSVLRTFRLLRILKLVRFMPNLRRQLFVMLRTMDNVAVFFSLLVLFIFIFSILGMYLFGGKFCKFMDEDTGQERECTCPEIINKHPHCECDRKHFNNILWATVTVFQILTQEDWNVVLFNGMEKTSHWAALYFVTLMTFGNYVLFNLLVAILVEGFSSERNERREREQRELVKKLREETLAENFSDVLFDESRSTSDTSSTNESYYEVQNKWHSAEDIRKLNEANEIQTDPKCNIQKQRLLQPSLDYQLNDTSMTRKHSDRDVSKLNEEDRRALKKTYSIKERRSESSKLTKLRPLYNPPIIMTTAATPQDSPSTILDNGSGFRNWSQEELELAASMRSTTDLKSDSSSSLLRPPSLISGPRAFDEGIPSIEFIPPSPIVERKPINILNANNLGSSTSINLGNSRLLTDDISKLSSTSIHSSIISARGGIGDDNADASTSRDFKLKPIDQSASLSSSAIQIPRTPSFRRFRRTSSKRKKSESAHDDENIILNNGRDSTQLLRRNDSILRSTNRIQNNTKDTNKLSPQNSVRRMSTASMSRRSSCVYNNSQFYQNLNRHSSIKNYSKRRMSSIEIALGKSSNLNLYNLENRKSISYANSKIDLEKWQKSISSLNEPETQQMKRQHSISYQQQQRTSTSSASGTQGQNTASTEHVSKLKILIERLKPKHFMEEHEEDSLYIFPEDNRFRQVCTWFVNQKWFDNVVLLFIALNCITLAMERPNIPPNCSERVFLATANYVFTVVFTLEMFIKVVAAGMFYGPDAYFTSGWNIMDGSLVTISIIDLLMSLISESSPKIFGILRVFRLLRSLRPLRVINRAPGLKLVVQTLLSSLRPIGNIVLICCTFFIIFGILGVQLFKGTFYFCEGENTKGVRNKDDCKEIDGNVWINRKYNFDDLGKALMSLFVLSSRDGWVNIMYTGLDAVGVDQQPIVNYNEWRLLYFIAFILLVGFFVLNMFVGVVVENFHRCREEQEKEEKIRRAAKRALQMEKKRRQMHMPPYYTNYSPTRLFVHSVVTSKYFDLAIAAVIGLNVVTMALEYYKMPVPLEYALKIFNYFFTAVFILEAIMKLVALGWRLYMKDKWNQLDVGIVILSIVGIVLEELETNIIPINPTIIRVMRVLRIARVLKLLKMAKGIRALLDTVMQALPQVGNLGLLFFLLFFIFAALGVELFGRLECSDEIPCQGLGEHAHFANFGMAFLTLFRVATGDNWNGIMKDTLRNNCDEAADCVRNCCVSSVIAPIFFVIFVLMAQFVLVNVVVAVLMKHLEESHKQMEDEMDMDFELERELVREQEFEEEQALCMQLQAEESKQKRPLEKVSSLPSNFTYSTPSLDKKFTNTQRRQTVQYFNQTELLMAGAAKPARTKFGARNSISEEATESVAGSVAAGVDADDKQLPMYDISFQIPGARRAKRGSLFRKKRMLSKERSLDEQGIRQRYLESKRMSCDSLPWGGDTRKTTIFESTESENGGGVDYDIRSVKSENCPPTKPMELTLSDHAISHTQLPSSTLDVQVPAKTLVSKFTAERKQQFGRSATLDQSSLAPPRTTTLLLSVPRSMPPRSRSGSTKQLFKQQALDEDPDMDESSLLLPISTIKSQSLDKPTSERSVEGMSKSDSAEIMRIIAERRRMDKIDNSGNEDSDYNELLLVKSSHSSIDA